MYVEAGELGLLAVATMALQTLTAAKLTELAHTAGSPIRNNRDVGAAC